MDGPLFPKKFPENFIDGIVPPFRPVNMSLWGGYGRGDPHIGGYAVLHGGGVYVDNLYPPPLCVIVSCG
jgi:hypothetical protein